MARKFKQPIVLHTSAQEAKAETGYFSISSLMITDNLGKRIEDYLTQNKLVTWRGENQAQTSSNTYTVKFKLCHYCREQYSQRPYYLISHGGAYGNYNRLKGTKLEKNSPSTGWVNKMREDMYRKEEDTPTTDQLYFWIAKKYPGDILGMSYHTKDPLKLEL